METLTDSFEVEGKPIHIELEQYRTSDLYATNLELTGQGTWFGSLHMCNFLAAEARNIFQPSTSSTTCATEIPSESSSEILIQERRPFHLLELGSGLGRAGLMAGKVMSLLNIPGTCVLTDGEVPIVNLLERNIQRNNTCTQSNQKDNIVTIQCQKLWWGLEEDLNPICEQYPNGFDVVIGADLIYGHDIQALCTSLMQTVHRVIGEGKFILAFTRRDVAIEDVLKIAEKNGLDANVHPDWTLDIFEESVDFESEMWRDTIVIFTRSKEKKKESLSEETEG